ncbi:hypothetical protein TSUD_178280 [Trifolium subterraneum]|uniref:Uncharacterized protein n=1 Tax=Trifolium subterraneum TaxID=3900 RepID=A0A2Z6MGH9_TRISU|nr:hypothetical protein TSUD_178280 [Trifolium subterraneum]
MRRLLPEKSKPPFSHVELVGGDAARVFFVSWFPFNWNVSSSSSPAIHHNRTGCISDTVFSPAEVV